MSETRTAELLAQASRFLRENAARIQVQRYPNSWSTYQQAMVDCAIGLDALRAPQGPGWQPTLTEDQFQHAACVAMEYGSRAGYLALLDYMKLPPVPSSGSGEGR